MRLLFLLLLCSCATSMQDLSPKARAVRVIKVDPPLECVELEQVSSGIILGAWKSELDYYPALKHETAVAGGNVVMLIKTGGAQMRGMAYRCPTK